MRQNALKREIPSLSVFSGMSVYARPHPERFSHFEPLNRRWCVAQTSKSAVSRVSKPAAGVTSGACRLGSRRYSRFGNLRYQEVRGEGGRRSWFQGQILSPAAKLTAVLLFALSFSPTSLWACAACTGLSDSSLAVAMNWGIVTLLGVVLTVLSGVLVFFVHVIRKEEAASNDTPPENPPST